MRLSKPRGLFICLRQSKPVRLAAITSILAVLFLTPPCDAQDTPKKQVSTLQFLFVQSAKRFTYADGKLSLHGISPYTIYFTDRPARIAGHITVQDYIDWGREAKDSFTENPPNGTLSIISGNAAKNIVMVLKDAELEGNTLSYKVRILEGEMPPEGGINSLFIDIIGMPLTPLSFAGVHRRWRRRAIVYGAGAAAAYGAAAATAASAYRPTTVVVNQPAQPAPAAPPPAAPQTTESKLEELKSMLDNGLISQSDYENKKKQLLANF